MEEHCAETNLNQVLESAAVFRCGSINDPLLPVIENDSFLAACYNQIEKLLADDQTYMTRAALIPQGVAPGCGEELRTASTAIPRILGRIDLTKKITIKNLLFECHSDIRIRKPLCMMDGREKAPPRNVIKRCSTTDIPWRFRNLNFIKAFDSIISNTFLPAYICQAENVYIKTLSDYCHKHSTTVVLFSKLLSSTHETASTRQDHFTQAL
ncbi:hypothetical protein KIN20_016505 [Parelaphostrongylus tenuis]|uniref:Uncharacterized protein n=1 Tax=Parelaphostrongylus tenuis TaxID=148309 RepID=A0AAD5MGK2_PARTN|nr:hypothetical protein KIN20_016505 [Parelaphostrongylus tenuis]